MWLYGEPSPRMNSFKARVPISKAPSYRIRELVRLAATTSPAMWIGDRDNLAVALALNPRAARTLHRADAVVPVGQQAWSVVDRLVTRHRPLVTSEELNEWEQIGAVWRKLRRRVDAGPTKLDAKY